MRNILIQLVFVGTPFSGWQRQKNGLAIQEVVETAVSKITGEQIKLTGCSRTDAGVHAEQFYANFKTESRIPTPSFVPAIQSELPKEIMIRSSKEVPPDFNARKNAVNKVYRYQICLRRSPFMVDRWWQCRLPIDFNVLPALAEMIVGEHDFSGFCVRRSLKADNRCAISEATWRRKGSKLYFRIEGNRFLHRMVRFLVGSQVEVAAGKLSEGDFERTLLHPDKYRALFPAPAEGLYLHKVKY